MFERVVPRLAFRQAQPPAVIMQQDGDVVRIVEECRAAGEGGVVEAPPRRGGAPDEPGEGVAVFFLAQGAALRREVVLIPSFQCIRGDDASKGRPPMYTPFVLAFSNPSDLAGKGLRVLPGATAMDFRDAAGSSVEHPPAGTAIFAGGLAVALARLSLSVPAAT